MADDAQPEQVIRDLFDWMNGDASKIDAMSESIDVYNPGLPNGEVHDREKWEKYVSDVKAGFPDVSFSEEEQVANGNIVMSEVKITATHEGTFKGLPPTGREVEIWGMDKFLIEDGQVEEWYTYYDTAALREQLGLAFPEVIGRLPKLAWGTVRSSI